MTIDTTNLQAAALACDPGQSADETQHDRRMAEFYAECEPTQILALATENETFKDGLRSLACSLSAGGYNAEHLTAAQLLEKVNWGVDNLSSLFDRRLQDVTGQRDRSMALVQALTSTLQQFVDAAVCESQEGQHITEAVSLLAWMRGDLESHSLVPTTTISRLHVQNELLRADAERQTQIAADERANTLHYCGQVGRYYGGERMLREAAENLLEHTEAAHRPPVRDEIEHGRMVLVRLHALADLQDVLNTLNNKVTP